MEQWPEARILAAQAEVQRHHHHHRPVRVLGDTSGNVQTYPQEFKPGIENRVAGYDVPSLKVPVPIEGQYKFPPAPTLPSNDQGAGNIARLHARRQRKEHGHGFRRRFEEARPYLQCHKYIEYRSRRRQDTGEDGKPVWDDPMEEAFQNGSHNSVFWKKLLTLASTGRYQTHGQEEEVTEWEA